MLEYIKKYPLSLLIVATVLYLSFFTPPKTELDSIPNLDKLVHFCMYFGFSGMVWLEYLRSHKNRFSLQRTIIGAVILPILFSGCIELGQAYLTVDRSGDWRDFAANATGVVCVSLIAYFIVRPRINHRDMIS